MIVKNLLLGISILVGILAVSTNGMSANLAQADVILCPGPSVCEGTQDSDNMLGDDTANQIIGFGDNDVINGKGGSDTVVGTDGDDVVSGGSGADSVIGGQGGDKLIGGSDNDLVYQSFTGPIRLHLMQQKILLTVERVMMERGLMLALTMTQHQTAKRFTEAKR